MFKRVLIAALTALVLGTPALANQDDLVVFRNVQKQVLGYPLFTIFDTVNAQVEEGIVVLSGKVTMPFKRDEIERRVRSAKGVTEVVNRIDVLPVSQFDDDLRLRIARAIYANPAFRGLASQANPPIHVIVERGRVTLDGVVLNEGDRVIAQAIASQFLTFAVTNQLKTEAEVKRDLEKL